LVIGLECGGSDGFSGISANPALGRVSDLVVALGGSAILSEFPELCGAEQNLINRCESEELADKFIHLMESYNSAAKRVGSGFDMNPSPGNIKDGLLTDAIKSCGAAKKGGTAPISDVLDYTEYLKKSGLNLLCTPGNDVESTTGLAGSGANIILFTTGLGTPTGNPICPVIKVATNTKLANRMSDIIDFDSGSVISGDDSIESCGERLLELVVRVASGKIQTKAEQNKNYDFIPWKRGVSL
jgi:altronate hydrolase